MKPLWTPGIDRIEATNIYAFMRLVEARFDLVFEDYAAFWNWSVDKDEEFWLTLWDFSEVICEVRGERVVADKDKMPGARWFPDARLSFPENMLRRRDDATALVFWGEDRVRQKLSFRELYEAVSRITQALADLGVIKGDRVVGFMPNMPETIMAMLAATSLGAIWSSCSPDFGTKGLLDRFGQINPKVLFTADGYFYNGKNLDSLERVRDIQRKLNSIIQTVVVPYANKDPSIQAMPKTVLMNDFVSRFEPKDIPFERVNFNDPLVILYSSGTTGMPKCIVHGHGGTLLQNLKEHRLHSDIKSGDRLFYFTTCGWMMWNWMLGALASEATLLLYDGSPLYPDSNTIFNYAELECMTHLGTSAKYIDVLRNQALAPIHSHNLSDLRCILTTGSVLSPESFDFIYSNVKKDVCLSSISGGTDLLGCFAGGNPAGPVWRGELQCLALGMAVDVFDDEGKSITGQNGELVCKASFPSMPVRFWGDPEGTKYHDAYFNVYADVWRHGDWCERTKNNGLIIHGRSDTLLNPGGVRIGTAEIYRQIEQLGEVEEGLVIGQEWQGDTRIVLFVCLRAGLILDNLLMNKIKLVIRENTSPRHVPEKILQVPDLPRTISGKITELAVREIVHGREVKNIEAMANPEVLEFYRGRKELTD